MLTSKIIMKRLLPISQPVYRWRGTVAADNFARAFLFVLVAILAAGGACRAAKTLPTSSHPAVPALRHTLDDFDGDFRPDQVAVQTGNNEFSGTQYWIELRLSTAGRQLIPVFSLPGGLQVVARDVNGNGSLDLVLTTKSLRQPVAILLNDGHGRFTRAEPGAFPAAFREAESNWESRKQSLEDCAELLPSSRSLVVRAVSTSCFAPSLAGRIGALNRTTIVSLKTAPDSGRAPPSSVLL